MILVMDAGYQGTVAFSACRTLPLSTSTRMVASAAARATANPNAAQTAAAMVVVRMAVLRDRCIRYGVR